MSEKAFLQQKISMWGTNRMIIYPLQFSKHFKNRQKASGVSTRPQRMHNQAASWGLLYQTHLYLYLTS